MEAISDRICCEPFSGRQGSLWRNGRVSDAARSAAPPALAGRGEAGVFLLGLLSFYRDDLERLSPVVRALRAFPIPETVDALTAELRRIPSSNHTRTYLNGVVEAVTGFPDDLVRDRLAEL